MGHGEGWQYLQAGRYLERAGATAALLDLYFRRGSCACRRRTPSGSACCDRARRSRPTAAATPPTSGPSSSPSSCCSIRSSRARCGSRRREWSRPCGPSPSSPDAANDGRAERLAGRLHASLDYGQVDEILSEDPHAYLEASAATARRSTPRRIRPTSRIRSSRRCRLDRFRVQGRVQGSRFKVSEGDRAVHHPACDAVHLRFAHHRKRDGGARAAAQRGGAALRALRPEHDARSRACACIRITTATSSITSIFPGDCRD